MEKSRIARRTRNAVLLAAVVIAGTVTAMAVGVIALRAYVAFGRPTPSESQRLAFRDSFMEQLGGAPPAGVFSISCDWHPGMDTSGYACRGEVVVDSESQVTQELLAWTHPGDTASAGRYRGRPVVLDGVAISVHRPDGSWSSPLWSCAPGYDQLRLEQALMAGESVPAATLRAHGCALEFV